MPRPSGHRLFTPRAARPPVHTALPSGQICGGASAGGREGQEFLRHEPGGHLLGEQLAGDRAEGDAPHPVAARDEDPRVGRDADQRQAIGGARARADPLILAVVEVGAGEQRAGGLLMGATAGIGGTYAAMPRLYVKLFELDGSGQVELAARLQNDICRIIYAMCAVRGSMYALIKELLRRKGISCGSVRAPLAPLAPSDAEQADLCEKMIREAESRYL